MEVQSQFIEMMGDLPKNGTLSDYCEMKAGKSIKSDSINSQYNDGLYPCYEGNGLRGYVETYSHDGVYNIIGRQGVLCGNITLTKGKFYATEHAIVVRPKTPINEYWLYFALAQMNLNQYARGVAQPGLAVKQLEKLPFGIPSKGKQEKFAAVYQQADKSKFVGFKSQFIEMFGGEKYPLVRLGQYTNLNWGDTKTTKASYVLSGYQAYSASGPDGLLDHYDYDCEGIVLSAIGADCGKTWFAKGKWSCIKNTIRFWSISNELDNAFLFFATNKKEFWPRRGGAQPFIPQGDARNCTIPLPPMDQQQQFVSIAEQADKSKLTGHCLICVLNKGISKLIN